MSKKESTEFIEKEEKIIIIKDRKQEYEIEKLKGAIRYMIKDKEKNKIQANSIDNIETTYYNDYIDISIKSISKDITKKNSEIREVEISIKDCFEDHEINLLDEEIEKISSRILGKDEKKKFEKRIRDLTYRLDIDQKEDRVQIDNIIGGIKSINKEDLKEAFCEVITSDKQKQKIKSKSKRSCVYIEESNLYPGCVECSRVEKREHVSFPFIESNIKVCSECYEDFLGKYTNYTEGELVARKI